MIVQIYGTSHRGLIAIENAPSIEAALEKFYNGTARDGDKKHIRGDRLTITAKNGIKRSYTAKKA